MKKVVVITDETKFVEYAKNVFTSLEDIEFAAPSPKTDNELIAAVKDADAVLFTAVKLHSGIIDAMEKCKVIVRFGIGYDNVDTVRTAERGIFVCNTPNYGVIDVAEHAVSLMFATAKRLVMMNDIIRDNKWGSAELCQSVRLAGKTIGFAGFGNIGRNVCARTNACGMKPIVYDPYVSRDILAEYGAEAVSFDELLKRSDFLSMHMPLNDAIRHIMNAEAFAKMKPSAIFINTARGGLVDEAALIDALCSGTIAGAGLDVFEREGGEIDKRLREAVNVVLTPHVAWNTPDAVAALCKEGVDNVIRVLKGERPYSIVNGL